MEVWVGFPTSDDGAWVAGPGLRIYEGGFSKLFPRFDRGCREGSVTVTKGATTVDEFNEDVIGILSWKKKTLLQKQDTAIFVCNSCLA